MVDTLVLETSAEKRGGSSPLIRTKFKRSSLGFNALLPKVDTRNEVVILNRGVR